MEGDSERKPRRKILSAFLWYGGGSRGLPPVNVAVLWPPVGAASCWLPFLSTSTNPVDTTRDMQHSVISISLDKASVRPTTVIELARTLCKPKTRRQFQSRVPTPFLLSHIIASCFQKKASSFKIVESFVIGYYCTFMCHSKVTKIQAPGFRASLSRLISTAFL